MGFWRLFAHKMMLKLYYPNHEREVVIMRRIGVAWTIKTDINQTKRDALTKSRSKWKTMLLGCAAIVQMTVALAVFETGHQQLAPNMFDPSGIAISISPDSIGYKDQAITLANLQEHGSAFAWIRATPDIHVKLYSLCFMTFGRLVGNNIVACEPLNLTYYLLTLILVFKLGQLVFNEATGLISAGTLALWPSFLLHSTQLLRDPLSTLSFMTVILFLCVWLSKDQAWLHGLSTGFAAAGGAWMVWFVRVDMWLAVQAFVFLGALMVGARHLISRRLFSGSTMGAGLLTIVALVTPRIAVAITPAKDVETNLPLTVQSLPLAYKVAKRRQASIEKGDPLAGSNIDMDRSLSNAADVALYLPRAAVVGLFAPFPNMWFAHGNRAGLIGRLVAGGEMMITYLFQIAACFGVWLFRRQLATWFVLLVGVLGAVGLGLVVVNTGTLYRLRHPFWILLAVLGSAGIVWGTPKLVVLGMKGINQLLSGPKTPTILSALWRTR